MANLGELNVKGRTQEYEKEEKSKNGEIRQLSEKMKVRNPVLFRRRKNPILEA